MKSQNRKQFAGFVGTLLAVSALLIPASQFPKNKTYAETTVTESAVLSDDYAQEGKLFDIDTVHTVNLHISSENWREMTTHATEEKYVTCDVEIDGDLIQNVAIRPKGNSSLSSISEQGSTHFSFKIEFDHNDPTVTYYGLDKLCLNNLGQDPSCMKDFIAYHLMQDMGVAVPLSSYTVMQVNGQDFGLYLAVEAVEDAFCYRNYGEAKGQLYKPDSFSMKTLDTSGMLKYSEGSALWNIEQIMDGSYYHSSGAGDRADILGTMLKSVFTPEQTATAALQYVGDKEEDYADLWNTAVFKPKSEDKLRLMQSIETLNHSEQPQTVLDTEALLKYFAVHSFVNNYDSYTSLFVHNFYLYEQNGILSMIPWDYNLAFGSFTYETAVSSILEGSSFNAIPETGSAMDINTNMINYPIDTPVYSIDMQDRPILNALFSSPETMEQYHQYYDQLLKECFENGKYAKLYTQTYENIRPYVTQGLTFYETERFDQGAEAMQEYLHYRAESVRKQLDGSLASTLEGQQNDAEHLVIPEKLSLTALTDFASLKPELNAELITGIVQIFLQDKFSYDTKGAVNAVHYYTAHPFSLLGKIPALMQIPFIRRTVFEKTAPALTAGFLIIFAVIFFAVYRKRRFTAQKF